MKKASVTRTTVDIDSVLYRAVMLHLAQKLQAEHRKTSFISFLHDALREKLAREAA
jgi:hypothetical protein